MTSARTTLLLLIPLVLGFRQDDSVCRELLGCHKGHDAAKGPCPKCQQHQIPTIDAACMDCSAKEGICRHCGKSRGNGKPEAPDPFPTVKSVQKEIDEMLKAKPPSVSIGPLSSGRLENGAALPAKGVGFKCTSVDRKRNCGTDEMVGGLIELGARMHDLFGDDGVYLVGDISGEKGGKIGHINHQNGRDADLCLYTCDDEGRPRGNKFVEFDKEGKSKDGTLRFDVVRNWEFVVGMLESSRFGELRWIFLADWLKKLLLDHARGELAKCKNPFQAQRLQKLIKDAERLISQPSSSPHANHFHLSLKCSKEDRKLGGQD